MLSKDHSIAERLVSHEIPFENAEEAFRIADNADISLKVMIVDKMNKRIHSDGVCAFISRIKGLNVIR